jgi:pimeloyl-ACP methyl ester carboxylesterase
MASMQPLQLGHCPTLPRWCAEATEFPPGHRAEHDQRLAGHDLVAFPVGHNVHEARPAEFTAVALDFLLR